MAVKPPKDRHFAKRLIFGIVRFLGGGFYFLLVLVGLILLFGYSKITITNYNALPYFILLLSAYGVLAVVPRWLIKKKFRVWEYDSKSMSEAEAQVRADLGEPEPGSLAGMVLGLRDVFRHINRLRTDPQYARQCSITTSNNNVRQEAKNEATIPFYGIIKMLRFAGLSISAKSKHVSNVPLGYRNYDDGELDKMNSKIERVGHEYQEHYREQLRKDKEFREWSDSQP